MPASLNAHGDLPKTGDDKLRLHNRTFRCDCGLVIDRDLNAAMNLRRLGLQALGLQHINQDVGQTMPERALRRRRRKADACGEASGGRGASATLSHASRRQEPARSSTELSR
ncbi:hypothetical protein FFR93_05045 [Rhizobium sp. MHM7A]|nr:hypothetical protein FFR93_05045 [Rhizobium sp. MHM7A]